MLTRFLVAPRVNLKLAAERPYRFGETIDAVIEVVSRADILVREGRLDLMCDVRHTESKVIMIPDRRARMGPFHSRALLSHPLPEVLIPKRISEEQHFRFPIGSAIFSAQGIVRAGTSRFEVSLPVSPFPPSRAGSTGVTYELVVALDITMGRDAVKRRSVNMALI